MDCRKKSRRLPAAKTKRQQLISSAEAVPAETQHERPCDDCPWSRKALNGWLGGFTVDDWLSTAHSDAKIECHVNLGAQCAGSAIYRTNVVKSPRDPEVLRLPADREAVFARPDEFRAHHESAPKRPSDE
jgi:hypothetical protein